LEQWLAVFDSDKSAEDRWLGIACAVAGAAAAIFSGYFILGAFPLTGGVVALLVGLAASLFTCISVIGGFEIAMAISEIARNMGDSSDMICLNFAIVGALFGLFLSFATGTGHITTALAVALFCAVLGGIAIYAFC